LGRIWEEDISSKSIELEDKQEEQEFVSSPLEQDENITDILNTPCR
jgi:hypothetical protein